MVDKPKDRADKLIEWIFQFCGNLCDKVKETLEKPAQAIAQQETKKPGFKKILATVSVVAVCGLIIAGYAIPRTVTVHIDTSHEVVTTEYKTTARRVDTFLDVHEVDFVDGQDVLDWDYHDGIRDGMEIHITKAFDVKVTADGNTYNLTTLPTTTADVLAFFEITLDEDDLLEPSMDTQLKGGDEIVVKRVEHTTIKEKDVDEYQTIYQASGSIQIGKVETVQEGVDGLIENTYNVTLVDGVETERELIETEVISERQDEITYYGTYMNFSKPSGLTYVKKYEDVRAISYHFGGNPRGAYGKPCTFGTCAVDKNLIPLGSLLYIEGYGYAIANDVGTSIKGKTVDVYMEEYKQCLIWGARWTTVYVIREGA